MQARTVTFTQTHGHTGSKRFTEDKTGQRLTPHPHHCTSHTHCVREAQSLCVAWAPGFLSAAAHAAIRLTRLSNMPTGIAPLLRVYMLARLVAVERTALGGGVSLVGAARARIQPTQSAVMVEGASAAPLRRWHDITHKKTGTRTYTHSHTQA